MIGVGRIMGNESGKHEPNLHTLFTYVSRHFDVVHFLIGCWDWGRRASSIRLAIACEEGGGCRNGLETPSKSTFRLAVARKGGGGVMLGPNAGFISPLNTKSDRAMGLETPISNVDR